MKYHHQARQMDKQQKNLMPLTQEAHNARSRDLRIDITSTYSTSYSGTVTVYKLSKHCTSPKSVYLKENTYL